MLSSYNRRRAQPFLHRGTLVLAVAGTLLALKGVATAQLTPDQQAAMLLDSARRACNERQYAFASARFREFVQKFPSHPRVSAAHYGLALALLGGPDRDYTAAAAELRPLAGNKSLPEYPYILYHLGLACRGQGVRSLDQAAATPAQASQQREIARQRFEEAAAHFAAAADALVARLPSKPNANLPPSDDLEWGARARCDQAEMLLRVCKSREAQVAAGMLQEDGRLRCSRYRDLGRYYHGLASFQLGQMRKAENSLKQLAPFRDPVFGTHARYLLARVEQERGRRQAAQQDYEGVLADHARLVQGAAEDLRQPNRTRDDPEEKTRLQRLVNGPPPEHVARSAFFLAVLLYEESRFAEALARFRAFVQQFPSSAMSSEAQLRLGCCLVQLKNWEEAIKILQPLLARDPRLADQALLWLARTQLGQAGSGTTAAHDATVRTALGVLHQAAERSAQLAGTDALALRCRGEILLETADALQQIKQPREAAAIYIQLLSQNLLPRHQDQIRYSLAAAWQAAGEYGESDKVCMHFRTLHPASPLMASLLFRYAENAYLQALAADKIPDPNYRRQEAARLDREALQRYQTVIDRYPRGAQTNLARLGAALACYRIGQFGQARTFLEAIAPDARTGPLTVAGYYLADILIRTAPRRADDAASEHRLSQQLTAAAGQLESFLASAPEAPQAPDALLKTGYCHQRIAALLPSGAEQARSLAAARAAYELLLQRFPRDPAYATAVLERAKILNQANDRPAATRELERFLNDPLKSTTTAPRACLYLARLLREESKPAQAATVLEQCRKDHEARLLAEPAGATLVPLLRYHHGICLHDAGKWPEARAILELVITQSPECPEAAEAALSVAACLQQEGETRIAEGRRRLLQPNLKAPDRLAAQKMIDEGAGSVRSAIQYLGVQAEHLRQKHPESEARARMLYDSAWLARGLAALEIEAARHKLQQELWQKRMDEVAKSTPPGEQPPQVPLPELSATAVPVQPSEAQARAQYQALIAAFPRAAITTDAQFELAELFAQRGEYDAAIKLLNEAALQAHSTELTEKIRLRLGAILLSRGDARNALAQFRGILDKPASGQWAWAMCLAGEACLQRGDASAAVQHLVPFRDKPQLQSVPGVTDRALLRLGQALGLLKQWDASRQALELIASRFGGGPWVNEARYGIAWAYQNQGHYDKAVSWYGQVAESTATELAARAQMSIGLCRLAQKRYSEASTALLVVPFTYDYPHLSALSLLEAARALSEDRHEDQAARLLQRVLRDYPGTPEAQAAQMRLDGLNKS